MILKGIIQVADLSYGGRIYPKEAFQKSIEQYEEDMREQKELQTYKSVTVLGGDLYVKFGASEEDIILGYEYFAANSNDPRVIMNALKQIIYRIEERIKNNHL